MMKGDSIIRRKSTHKVFLEFLYFLLVALQPAVVHGSALDGNFPHLQVHLLQLKPAMKQLTLVLAKQLGDKLINGDSV